MQRFILIENSAQLSIFLKKYRSEFTPIIYDVYCQALLEKEAVDFITINHELSYSEILGIYREAWEIGEILVDELDKMNEDVFHEIFGFHEIKLFRTTAKYLLTYCLLSNLFHCAVGLSRILGKNRPCSIYYFPFDLEGAVFSSSNITDYFCPRRIVPAILDFFKSDGVQCVELNEGPNAEYLHSVRRVVVDVKFGLKDLLRRILFADFLLPTVKEVPAEKNILVISCGHHLRPVMKSLAAKTRLHERVMGEVFYVVAGDWDSGVLKLKDVLTIKNDQSKRELDGSMLRFDVSKLTEKVSIHSSLDTPLRLNLLQFVGVITEKFLQANIGTMVNVWDQIKSWDLRYQFAALLWDSPTVVDVRKSVISEFFSVVKKPRIGVQHGGAYGCKHYGYAHFDSDFDNCEYFFSYGYTNADLVREFNGRKTRSKILVPPKGRNRSLKSTEEVGERIKVLYVFPENNEVPFFQLARPNRIDEFLFEFQKKIVTKLSQYKKEKVMLKFPPGNFNNHPLRVFIERLEHAFIIDTVPFTDVLKKYSPEYILIDVISSPLEQSLPSQSQYLLYNNPCSLLTEDAFDLLSKRAVLTSDEEEFLAYIDKIFNNSFPKKDVFNTEYMEKYGSFPFGPGYDGIRIIGQLICDGSKKSLAGLACGDVT